MKNVFNNMTNLVKRFAHNAAYSLLIIASAVTASIPMTVPSVSAQAVLEDIVAAQPTTTTTALPHASDREAPRTMKLSVTAYNSEVGQTDSTPFHTADMTHVRDGIVAANFLPLGTRVKFPEIYGDKEFVIKDRMNRRYNYRADIWMEHKTDAINFGHQYTTIEIY